MAICKYCCTLFKTMYGQHFYSCLLMLILRCSYNYNWEIRWLVWTAAEKRWELCNTVVLSTITVAHQWSHKTRDKDSLCKYSKSAEGECLDPNSLLSQLTESSHCWQHDGIFKPFSCYELPIWYSNLSIIPWTRIQ